MASRSQWKAMLRRCEDPRAPNYRYYGGRGITVCGSWHDYGVYAADIMRLIGPRPDGTTLDRIDNDRGYEPGNVRWATASEQQLNTRNATPGRVPRPPRPRRPAPAVAPSRQMRRPGQVCDQLGISRETFRKLVKRGDLRAMKTGPQVNAHWRVSEEAVADYIRRRTESATAS